MSNEHILDKTCQARRPLKVLVIGAGGNGSGVFLQLPYLHQALRVWGHEGLRVELMDGDLVSETNCVRQPFATSDVGINKALVLVNRVNLFWGLEWGASSQHFHAPSMKDYNASPDVVISCVDTRAARATIAKAVCSTKSGVAYWLDLGKRQSYGLSHSLMRERARKTLASSSSASLPPAPEECFCMQATIRIGFTVWTSIRWWSPYASSTEPSMRRGSRFRFHEPLWNEARDQLPATPGETKLYPRLLESSSFSTKGTTMAASKTAATAETTSMDFSVDRDTILAEVSIVARACDSKTTHPDSSLDRGECLGSHHDQRE